MTLDITSAEGRISLAMLFVSLVSAACWVIAFRRGGDFWRTVKMLAPSRRRTPAFWTPLDAVVVLFATLFIVQLLFTGLLAADIITPSSTSMEFNTNIDPLAMVVCVVAAQWISILGCTWLLSRRGPAISSIGWRCSRQDLSLGLFWSLLLIPATLWINFIVSRLVPYEHEVLDTLQVETDARAVALLFIATAIVTPIAEEFMFRGLLQRSLTRIASFRQLRKRWREAGNDQQRSHLLAEQSRYRWTTDADVSMWPVYVSSIIFAALHIGQGAAPIPLFFFAVGLGWLYRRTGRLWPSIIVHMVLNGLTLAVTIAAPNVG